jgi:hypothetical protein
MLGSPFIVDDNASNPLIVIFEVVYSNATWIALFALPHRFDVT